MEARAESWIEVDIAARSVERGSTSQEDKGSTRKRLEIRLTEDQLLWMRQVSCVKKLEWKEEENESERTETRRIKSE